MKDDPIILKRFITRDGHVSPIVEAPEIRPNEHFALKQRLRSNHQSLDADNFAVPELRRYEAVRAKHCILYEFEEE